MQNNIPCKDKQSCKPVSSYIVAHVQNFKNYVCILLSRWMFICVQIFQMKCWFNLNISTFSRSDISNLDIPSLPRVVRNLAIFPERDIEEL